MPNVARCPKARAAHAGWPLRAWSHARPVAASLLMAGGMRDDDLAWLQDNLPDMAVCKADRADPSLARKAVVGKREWMDSAEGRNGTMVMQQTRPVRARAEDAQSRLLLANMGLVVQLARRYENKGISLADLVQEGSLGLLHAMGRYDPDRNVKFVTFAYYSIQQHIARAAHNKGYTIRIPVHVHEARRRVLLARESLAAEGVLTPSTEQLAEKARLPVRKLNVVHSLPSVVSLDAALLDSRSMAPAKSPGPSVSARASRGTPMSDIIPDKRQPSPDDAVQEEMFRVELDRFLRSTLEPDQYQIVRLRYGLDDGRCGHSLPGAPGEPLTRPHLHACAPCPQSEEGLRGDAHPWHRTQHAAESGEERPHQAAEDVRKVHGASAKPQGAGEVSEEHERRDFQGPRGRVLLKQLSSAPACRMHAPASDI